MCKKIDLTLSEYKAVNFEYFVCTSVRTMKYLTEQCDMEYLGIVITKDKWTVWLFREGNELKTNLKKYKASKIA